ncbi:MAG: helix-turn-helix domain-containing protein [Nocardioidaceae bacterium]|nr:helix-turn-helix domain-containing protein [Nocardioidaceae bacterium]
MADHGRDCECRTCRRARLLARSRGAIRKRRLQDVARPDVSDVLWVGIGYVADHLGISPRRVQQLADDGRIPHERRGRTTLFRKDRIDPLADAPPEDLE